MQQLALFGEELCPRCRHPMRLHPEGGVWYREEDAPRERVRWCLVWVLSETENYLCKCYQKIGGG